MGAHVLRVMQTISLYFYMDARALLCGLTDCMDFINIRYLKVYSL
jgi:hypothetical protein